MIVETVCKGGFFVAAVWVAFLCERSARCVEQYLMANRISVVSRGVGMDRLRPAAVPALDLQHNPMQRCLNDC